MKVFMSWSGNRSRETAELLANWAKCVVQATQPWISTSGIDRGAVWYSAINEELNNTSVGIVCLTHENKNKPWILFESGALAKGLADSRVCTFLVDLSPSDLEPPLSQFNHTTPDRIGMWNLARTLNNSVAIPLDAKILEQVFDINYSRFEEAFRQILAAYPLDEKPKERTPDSILSELLDSSRSISQRLRTVENRVSGVAANQSIHVHGSSMRFTGGGEGEPVRTVAEGVQIGLHLLKNGRNRVGIQAELLSLAFGKKNTKEIIEVLEMLDSRMKGGEAPEINLE